MTERRVSASIFLAHYPTTYGSVRFCKRRQSPWATTSTSQTTSTASSQQRPPSQFWFQTYFRKGGVREKMVVMLFTRKDSNDGGMGECYDSLGGAIYQQFSRISSVERGKSSRRSRTRAEWSATSSIGSARKGSASPGRSRRSSGPRT